MYVAKITDKAAIFTLRQQHPHLVWFGNRGFRLDRVTRLVTGTKVFSIKREVGSIFACQHRIRLSSRRHQYAARRQFDFLACTPLAIFAALLTGEPNQSRQTFSIHLDRRRTQALRKPDTLLKCFLYFFVVQRIGRTIDHPAPISDGDAPPVPQQAEYVRFAPLLLRRRPLTAYGARMLEEFIGNFALLLVPS